MRWLIRLYQKTLSPDHGLMKVFFPNGCCRFHPTCSEYAIQALKAHGTARGVFLMVKRLLRCHPWGDFGPDPIPPRYPQSYFLRKNRR